MPHYTLPRYNSGLGGLPTIVVRDEKDHPPEALAAFETNHDEDHPQVDPLDHAQVGFWARGEEVVVGPAGIHDAVQMLWRRARVYLPEGAIFSLFLREDRLGTVVGWKATSDEQNMAGALASPPEVTASMLKEAGETRDQVRIGPLCQAVGDGPYF